MQFRRAALLVLLSLVLLSACGDSKDGESKDKAATPVTKTTTPAVGTLALRSEVVAVAPWGPQPGQLGRTNTQEAGVQIPLSITVGTDGTIYVLDQVNKRIAPYANGAWGTPIPLPAGNVSDIVFANGSLWALDQGAAHTWRLTEAGWGEAIPLALPKLPVFAPFWFDATTNTIYVRNTETGDDYPVIAGGIPVLATEQKPRQGAGAYVKNGALTVRTLDGSLTPVGLEGKVNEATDITVDPTGSVWLFAGVQMGDKEPFLNVVRVDGTTHSVLSKRVDVTTAGDTTRRLALTPTGAVVMSSNPDATQVLKFTVGQPNG